MRLQGSPAGLNSSFDGLVCDDFAIVRLRHGAPVTIEPEVADEYVVHHKLSGSGFLLGGATRIDMSPGVVTVTSPGQETKVEMASNSVNVVVRLPRKKVETCLQDVLQQTIKRPIVFDMRMEPHGSVTAAWAEAIRYVCGQHDILGRASGVGPGLQARFAEHMIGLLLLLQPHNYSSLMAGRDEVAPHYYVSQAQEYLHDNISEHISMAMLAKATGVSARTLQAGFRRCLGRTPMEYLRQQRLRLVHQELMSAGQDTRVTDVFMKFGIYDFGRYAGFYRERYGILPSERLKGRRRS